MKCRHCGKELTTQFLNLGFAPPSNAYLEKSDLSSPELYFPLKIFICTNCWLAQTEDYARSDELFSKDYAYFSSTSTSWLKHASDYVNKIIPLLGINTKSFVIEVASNDGYLLKNFVARGIPCLGLEPTASTASAAKKLNIPVIEDFFASSLAQKLSAEGKQADLIIGNNVFAHVPDINDFTLGLKTILKPDGTITLEFPHLMRLIKHCQFDTMYHEHYSYLSLATVAEIFDSVGLRVFDVEEISTHGGSIRIYGCHADDKRQTKPSVQNLIQQEIKSGLQDIHTYTSFQNKVDTIKNNFLSFLIEQKRENKKVAAYGAAAKGNTLLNYAGVKTDIIKFVCDAAPSKQGKYLPGTHIPILPPEELRLQKPDTVIIFPWNILDEISAQHNYIREWGGHFVVAVPEMKIL